MVRIKRLEELKDAFVPNEAPISPGKGEGALLKSTPAPALRIQAEVGGTMSAKVLPMRLEIRRRDVGAITC